MAVATMAAVAKAEEVKAEAVKVEVVAETAAVVRRWRRRRQRDLRAHRVGVGVRACVRACVLAGVRGERGGGGLGACEGMEAHLRRESSFVSCSGRVGR